MKITGITIIRNAILNDYPVVESIESILPVVDEMIVSVDRGDDETEQLIKSINSTKIRIVYSQWDMSLRKGGEVLAVETDKVMQHVSDDTDWVFYIQADEIVHEDFHSEIRNACKRYLPDQEVEGLLFKYFHFYGTYQYEADSRKWYNCETRIIRNDRTIKAYRDAQGFRKNGQKLKVAAINAYVYHYGWVKSPKQMKTKQVNVSRFWNENDPVIDQISKEEELFDYEAFDSLKKFTGTHPAVMNKRIQAQSWQLNLDVSKKNLSFKNKLLYLLEKITGKRFFIFSNHRVIRNK